MLLDVDVTDDATSLAELDELGLEEVAELVAVDGLL